MRVGKLRSLGSHPVVGRPAILLLFAWFVSGYLDWQPTGGWRDDAGVRLRYVDRELLLLKAGENENGLVRWLTGADNPAETCQFLRLSLPETAGDMESWYLPIVHQVLVRYEAEGSFQSLVCGSRGSERSLRFCFRGEDERSGARSLESGSLGQRGLLWLDRLRPNFAGPGIEEKSPAV